MTTTTNIQEIKSLINLMDDPDPEVFSQIAAEVIKRGDTLIPWLEETIITTENPLVIDRITQILQRLQLQNTLVQLETWVHSRQDNLLMGALIIARYQFPTLREETIIKRLGHITQDIYLRIKPGMTPLEKVKIVNTVLYDDYEFYGNKRDYQSPNCSYLNMVFETGKGNHLSLGIVYMLVARSLGIPITGVDLDDYFFLGYHENGKMLFYINPFSRGNTLTQNELLFFLRLAEIEININKIEPASNIAILRRMVGNLSDAYEKGGFDDKAFEMNQMMDLLRKKGE